MKSPKDEPSSAPDNPDIELTADVKTRELRFDAVPDTEVHPASETERENLPEKVQAGITYRNASVRLRIANEISTEGSALGKAERRSNNPKVGEAGAPRTSGQEKQKSTRKETK